MHDRLVTRGIDHEIIEHRATYAAGAEAEAIGVPRDRVAKTIVAVDGDRCWLAVIPASRRLDLRRLRNRVGGSRHLRLATEAEIARRFSEFDVGATPPLGSLIGASEVIDPLLLAHDSIVCSGGDHVHAMRLAPGKLVAAADPDVADICVHLVGGHRTRFAEVPLGHDGPADEPRLA
ncbi:MAG: aminoacyl-tRNA deacylase [Solirubrobacteraceae bacterium]